MKHLSFFSFLAVIGMLIPSTAQAQVVNVTIDIENIAPTDSISFAPLHVGFHSGIYDAFDNGTAAGDAIKSIAEGGSGTNSMGTGWFAEFGAADPNALLGTVVNGGPSVPGGNAGVGNSFNSTASATFTVDTDVNSMFTFANMVVPSNDLFLGNDAAIQLFDGSGNLLVNQITLTGNDIWDAGSEVAAVANAAFLVNGNNGDRIEENDVVNFSFDELAVLNGEETAAGYFFDSSLINGNTGIYQISFSVSSVPEPSSLSILGVGLVGLVARRRRKR